jgi:hypothetical protein
MHWPVARPDMDTEQQCEINVAHQALLQFLSVIN